MQNDNELMKKAIAGNKAAFDEIVISHRKAAIVFAYSFVSDYGIAEDIVQDAFVKIYLQRAGYKLTYTFKTYLYTLIRNSSIDYLRAYKIRATYLQGIQSKVHKQELSAEEAFLYENKYEEIAEVFNNLKGDYRTALYLYAVSECSYKDIATIMKKTVAQTKITIHRARKKLQRLLEEKK